MSDMKLFSIPDSNGGNVNNALQQTVNAGFNGVNISIQPQMDINQGRDNLNVCLQTYAYAYFGVSVFYKGSSFIGIGYKSIAFLQRKTGGAMWL